MSAIFWGNSLPKLFDRETDSWSSEYRTHKVNLCVYNKFRFPSCNVLIQTGRPIIALLFCKSNFDFFFFFFFAPRGLKEPLNPMSLISKIEIKFDTQK